MIGLGWCFFLQIRVVDVKANVNMKVVGGGRGGGRGKVTIGTSGIVAS